jgi:hypothetical protein
MVVAAGGLSPCGAWGLCGAGAAQLANIPTMANKVRSLVMALIVLEALGALLLLVLIVWWTMFSGRKAGEPPSEKTDDTLDNTKK